MLIRILFVLLMLTPVPLWATTYHVSKSTDNGYSVGNDGNACTSLGAPCLTVLAGCNKLASGDTLLINNGTYTESLVNCIPSGGGSWATATTMQAVAFRQVIIQGSDSVYVLRITSGRNYIIVKDIVFDGTGVTAQPVQISDSGTDYPHHIRLDGLEIRDSYVACLYLGNPSTDTGHSHEILNTVIHTCGYEPPGPPYNQGIYFLARNVTLRNVEIYDTEGPAFAMYVSGGNPCPYDNLIDGVYLHGNGVGAGEPAIILACVQRLVVKNSLLVNGNGGGISAASGIGESIDGKFLNNTIANNGGGCFEFTHAGNAGNRIQNNICYNSGSIVTSGGGTYTLSNNTTADPSFVNAGANDYHLQSGSVAKGAGTDLSSHGVTEDYDGVSRPQGGTWDTGAFEFVEGGGGSTQGLGRGSKGLMGGL